MRRIEVEGVPVCVTGGTDREGGGDGPLLVLLHGFGAPGDDLVPLHRQLAAPQGVRFAFPAAPLDLGRELGRQYAGGRAWWLIDPELFAEAQRGVIREGRTRMVPEGLASARDLVTRVVSRLQAELGARPATTVLGGFSQGSMLSLDVALRSPDKPAALILMSGSVIAEDEWTPLLPTLAGVPVLQSHGRADPVLPYRLGEKLRGLLEGAGARHHFIEFAGGHTITNGVLQGVSDLLTSVFGPGG